MLGCRRRRFVGRGELREACVLASLQVVDLGLQLWTTVAGLDCIDDFFDVSFDALKIAFRGTEVGALLHSQPVHLSFRAPLHGVPHYSSRRASIGWMRRPCRTGPIVATTPIVVISKT